MAPPGKHIIASYIYPNPFSMSCNIFLCPCTMYRFTKIHYFLKIDHFINRINDHFHPSFIETIHYSAILSNRYMTMLSAIFCVFCLFKYDNLHSCQRSPIWGEAPSFWTNLPHSRTLIKRSNLADNVLEYGAHKLSGVNINKSEGYLNLLINVLCHLWSVVKPDYHIYFVSSMVSCQT